MSLKVLTVNCFTQGKATETWIKLTRKLIQRDTPKDVAQQICDAILPYVLSSAHPHLLLQAYLRSALLEELVSSQSLLEALLARCKSSETGGDGIVVKEGIELTETVLVERLELSEGGAASSTNLGTVIALRLTIKSSNVDTIPNGDIPTLQALNSLISHLNGSTAQATYTLIPHILNNLTTPPPSTTPEDLIKLSQDLDSLRHSTSSIMVDSTIRSAVEGYSLRCGSSASGSTALATTIPQVQAVPMSNDMEIDGEDGVLSEDYSAVTIGSPNPLEYDSAVIGLGTGLGFSHGIGTGSGSTPMIDSNLNSGYHSNSTGNLTCFKLVLTILLENGWATTPPRDNVKSVGEEAGVGAQDAMGMDEDQDFLSFTNIDDPEPATETFDFGIASSATLPSSSLTTPIPESSFQDLLRLGPTITSSPSSFLHYLILSSLEVLSDALLNPRSQSGAGPSGQDGSDNDVPFVGNNIKGLREIVWIGDGLGSFLGWWKAGGDLPGLDGKWIYPDTLTRSLQMMIASPTLQASFSSINNSIITLQEKIHNQVLESSSSAFGSVGFGGFGGGLGEGVPGFLDGTSPSIVNILVAGMNNMGLLGDNDKLGFGIIGDTSSSSGSGDAILAEMLSITDNGGSYPEYSPQITKTILQLIQQQSALEQFSEVVMLKLRNEAASGSVEGLLVLLTQNPPLLESLMIKRSPMEVLNMLRAGLEVTAWSSEDDAQAVLTRYGHLVSLSRLICSEYDLPLPPCLLASSQVYLLEDLDDKEKAAVAGWIRALFSSSGIDDEVFRSLTPPQLLRFATTLMAQACQAAQDGVITVDTLREGVTFFDQPFLSWTIDGVVTWLCLEIQRLGSRAAYHLDILSGLLRLGDFPSSVLRVQGHSLKQLLDPRNGLKQVLQSSTMDVDLLRQRAESGLKADKVITLYLDGSSNWLAILRYELRKGILQTPDFSSPALLYILRHCLLNFGHSDLIALMMKEFLPNGEQPAAIRLFVVLFVSVLPGFSKPLLQHLFQSRLAVISLTSNNSEDVRRPIALATLYSAALRSKHVLEGKVQRLAEPTEICFQLALCLYAGLKRELRAEDGKSREGLKALALGLAQDERLTGSFPMFRNLYQS